MLKKEQKAAEDSSKSEEKDNKETKEENQKNHGREESLIFQVQNLKLILVNLAN